MYIYIYIYIYSDNSFFSPWFQSPRISGYICNLSPLCSINLFHPSLAPTKRHLFFVGDRKG